MSEDALCRRIRSRFASGELPMDHPQTTWAGKGTAQTCGVCDEVIGAETVEIEANGADDKTRFYHQACYELLYRERVTATGKEASSSR